MIPRLNDPEWFKRMVRLNIDRSSALKLIYMLDLVSRHSDFSDSARQKAVEVGRSFALCLLNDGLIIPEGVARSWEKAFGIPYTVDPDRIIPELTDDKGRSWK